MNKLNTLSKLAIASVAGAVALSVPMKAEAFLLIDDFDVTSTVRTALDNTPDNDPAFNGNTGLFNTDPIGKADPPAGINGWVFVLHDVELDGWDRRSIYAELNSGDDVSAGLCSNCGAGELTSGAGQSQGWAAFNYSGPAIENEFTSFMFDYSSDLNGLDVELLLDDTVVAMIDDLPNTGGVGPDFLTSVMIDLMNAPSSFTEVEIRLNGAEAGDHSIDNAKLVGEKVPEPGTVLGLLAISGLGFGLKRKKQS